MSELPAGWTTLSLGEVAEFEMGQAPASSTCNTEGRGTVFVKAGEFGVTYPLVREWTTHPLKFAREGDVLICVVGATCGKLNLAIDCAIGRSVAAIRPNEAIGQKTLYRQLQLQVDRLRKDSTGTAQGVISKQMLADIPVFVPPTQEQTRIADQLDTLLARVQACNDRLDSFPELLRRFRQSVLKAAIVGDLTKAWRHAQGLVDGLQTVQLNEDEVRVPAAWQVLDVEAVIDPLRPLCYGVVQPGESETDGVPLIRVQDMIGGDIAVSKLRTVSTSIDEEYRRSRVKGGDLLISVVGTIGRTALVPDGFQANIARAVARVACRSGVQSNWLHHWFSSDPLQWHLLNSSKEVARKTLNLSDLARIAVPLPSLAEQKEIGQKVKAWLAIADRVAARYEGAYAQAKRVSTLLLTKAFRGELVPQDPNDEPASELLARIAVQRNQPQNPSKARKPRAPRAPQENHAMTKSRLDQDVMGQPYLASHLRRLGPSSTAEALFKVAELPVADFYKQLAWEVEHGHVKDRQSLLEPGDAA